MFFLQTDKNCGMFYPYQPVMMPPIMPYPQENNSLEQRLNNIEKRLAILEANLNQNLNSNANNNYQMI